MYTRVSFVTERTNSSRYGYGPYTDGIFSQGNYGIVTKMGFWLTLKQPAQSFLVSFEREEDFPEINELVKDLLRRGLVHSVPQLSSATQDIIANHYVKRSDIYNGEGPVPKEVWKKAMRDYSFTGECAWLFFGQCLGYSTLMPDLQPTTHRNGSGYPGDYFVPYHSGSKGGVTNSGYQILSFPRATGNTLPP